MEKPIESGELGKQGEGVLNNRREAMLRELNEKGGLNLPLTEDGYNEAGRSKGIVDRLALATGEKPEEIEKRFLSISRSKKAEEK